MDESRTAIAFATEPIFASLSNLLGNYENLPSVSDDIRKFELDELEVPHTASIDTCVRNNERQSMISWLGLFNRLRFLFNPSDRSKKDCCNSEKDSSSVTTTPKLFTETLCQTPFLSMPKETGRLQGNGEPLPNHFLLEESCEEPDNTGFATY